MKNKSKVKEIGSILDIPIDKIRRNENQPRKIFNEDEIDSLAQSIKENGLLQPITVKKEQDSTYLIVAGERRLRACQKAEFKTISAILIEASEEKAAVLSLIENLQRKDLSFFEEAYAIESLIESFNLSQEEAARKLGKAQSTLSNKLRLLKLPREIQKEIIENNLTERHARALLKIEDEERQKKAVYLIIKNKLNVSQSEKLIERLLAPQKSKPNVLRLFKDVRIFVNTINHAVETMRSSGIDADSQKSETDDYIEYLIKIPKQQYGRITNSKSAV